MLLKYLLDKIDRQYVTITTGCTGGTLCMRTKMTIMFRGKNTKLLVTKHELNLTFDFVIIALPAEIFKE